MKYKYGTTKYYPQKDRIPKTVHKIIDGNKICTKCGINYPVSNYPKRSDTETGYGSICRTCNNSYLAEKRKGNDEYFTS